ncbi:Lhr family helicase [Terriglobus aquaticus]|uniref:DEAD/DEAH box helicase n=1 Tax=Terriglobus aquaticus TaxID=940139 RepID=A0ABW9KMJ3_9BACT|nr:crosslink repair DNA glycosylase YcaQ family protein [Terriglobus aquaticus]
MKPKSKETRAKRAAAGKQATSESGLPAASTASAAPQRDVLELFHPVTAEWFRQVFEGPTQPQREGWPAIASGDSTLILAPTGTGKTLTAFLWCLDKLMLQDTRAKGAIAAAALPTPKPIRARRKKGEKPEPKPLLAPGTGVRVIYISPLKALAVDVERNLRSPLAGISNMAQRMGVPVHTPEISVRTGDTPLAERARFAKHPGDILITTPESLYLLLTSNASEALRTVETVIIDEIHALVPSKRGAHMALSLERLEALTGRKVQRIGLSATQRPLEEVARFLGGADGFATTGNREGGLGNSESAPGTSTGPVTPATAALAAEVDREPAAHRGFSGRGDDLTADNAALVTSDDAQTVVQAFEPIDTVAIAPEIGEQAGTAALALGDNDPPSSNGTIEPFGIRYRPVTIVNAGARKVLELTVEVPVEDMARLGEIQDTPSGPASQGPKRTSIWQSIHPRLLEIIRAHTSTILFVNARRIAERLAGAINELAGEQIARAHHGSLAASQRSEIEELLKAGHIRALVATSSLELGIDMGAVDLVIQIEAPPSVASGMQRIGRAGHQVGAPSKGIIFPKYRADLIACAAVTRAMHEGHVESTRYLRNALDVLAQQMVAIIAHPPLDEEAAARRIRKFRSDEDESPGISYDRLLGIIRSCSGYAGLSISVFDGVLDMLAGRYPSDEFGELRPRVTWDRQRGWITPRQGVKKIAILNGGTIPDRGLFGVFLSGERNRPIRVGELDEEMVFEARTGETFVLGASTWRIDEITHDRVLVSPAPGEPGKMPFWHGDQAGRPLEFGRRIGTLIRELRDMPRNAAVTRLTREHDLDQLAAENVLRYLADQEVATEIVPDDRTIVVERVRDELGDWRVCVMTPFGSRVHAPWAMAVTGRIRAAGGADVEAMWSEDGFVIRFPEADTAPDVDQFFPEGQEAAEFVQRQLGSTALFAAKFREAAARALLLPRRRADGRAPLWQQRKRAYDLLSVAARYPQFPMLLEAYRECLRDVFDMPALREILQQIAQRQIRVHTVDSRTPSPFASALLFSYVANYIYDGDAPLAERRAQALSIDQEQLRELLGDADLRELLDANAIEETEEQLQMLAPDYRARSMDGIHDLLLRLGDLNRAELLKRVTSAEVAITVDRLQKARRVIELMIGGEKRLIAVEDVARYRDALGIPLPPGLPTAFLEPAPDAMLDLIRRFGRTHGPFTTAEVAARFRIPTETAEAVLQRLVQTGRVVEGAFKPGGLSREWCDAEVLRTIRRRSLAKLRKEVEPVEQQTLARLFTHWQGVLTPRRGLDALLDVVETLQGAPLPASLLETEILPARIAGYKPADLDTLIAAGEVTWAGLEPLGERDGRIGLYLAEKLPLLWPVVNTQQAAAVIESESPTKDREDRVLEYLRAHGASFFQNIHDGTGGGYPGETIDSLWNLVWRGAVTNDSLQSLRAYTDRNAVNGRGTTNHQGKPQRRIHNQAASFRSRRTTPPTVQGRWALHPAYFASQSKSATDPQRSATEWSHAEAHQLLQRYGVVFRETAHAENLPGGFSAIYDVLKALEESGKIRRGYFAADLGATQFALPSALDLLRSLRTKRPDTDPEMIVLAATDPANPYGALLKWPQPADGGGSLTRTVGARVVLADGALVAYLRRGNPNLQIFLPEEDPQRTQVMRALARYFVIMGQAGSGRIGEAATDQSGRVGMLISSINGVAVAEHPMARALLDAGFQAAPMGFNLRRNLPPLPATMLTAQNGGRPAGNA